MRQRKGGQHGLGRSRSTQRMAGVPLRRHNGNLVTKHFEDRLSLGLVVVTRACPYRETQQTGKMSK